MPSYALLFALAATAVASVRADAASKIASLRTAANEVARVNLLEDQDVSDGALWRPISAMADRSARISMSSTSSTPVPGCLPVRVGTLSEPVFRTSLLSLARVSP